MRNNLEELILSHSIRMADEIQKASKTAGSEEDIRHEVNKLLDDFIKKADLQVKGRHEYGLAGGRIDSKYGGVVIEYKIPKGNNRISLNRKSHGFKAVVDQVTRRFIDIQNEEHVGIERILGIGCDGESIVFVRNFKKKFEIEDPIPVTKYSVERLLRAILSVGARGLSFTPENLSQSFGAESIAAQNGIRLISDVIKKLTQPKAKTFFKQWRILYSEVCGYDIDNNTSKIEKLAKHYSINNPNPSELLFAVHTYYGIFIKMLAAEIATSFSNMMGVSPIRKLINAPTSNQLLRELQNLEKDNIWRMLGIHNFLEGDLFCWYLDAWNDDLAGAIRGMVQTLDQYDPTTLSVDPHESRDLLKQLYQRLFPKSVRHDLGEYYTPDWTAELTLDELGYDGNPDSRILDPSCGSGTFLVSIINRIKDWFDENRYQCGFGEDKLIKKILRNVIGFDLNPLAVMAARTNYLMAIRDLLPFSSEIELPVYLCDSIMTPSEYGDLFTGKLGKNRKLKTSAEEFIIPNEIAINSYKIGRYADLLETNISDGKSETEFLNICESNDIPVEEKQIHKRLYRQLQKLHEKGMNGIWARIIKNSFAPLFIEKVDYIAGNPPWVNWESLPKNYRDDMKPLWQDYGLFTLKGGEARLGGGKKDLSMLFTYVAIDNYLKLDGKLGFVITQTVFKAKGAGEGFRRLKYTNNSKYTYIKPLSINDFGTIQIFEDATNHSSIFICKKQKKPFSYPVKYVKWSGKSRVSQELTLENVKKLLVKHHLAAQPVKKNDQRSPWLTSPETALAAIKKIFGKSRYTAHAGSFTGGLNGCYWIKVIASMRESDFFPRSDNLLIENLHDIGKIEVDQRMTAVEPEFVYPLLRGRDVKRWFAEPSIHILLLQDPNTRSAVSEYMLKVKYPKTYSYIKRFEGDKDKPQHGTLRGRAMYKKYYKSTDPFYSMYNVGKYTVSHWKVIWREQSAFFQAAVIGPKEDRPVVPDHKLMLVSCTGPEEAHFLAGMLNSAPSLLAIHSYVISTSTSTHVLENIKVPKYDDKNSNHMSIAGLSRKCHIAVSAKDDDLLARLEEEINKTAAKIWELTDQELENIYRGLEEIGMKPK